jgi:NAD(P)-dependent dehydrogenase (short-subunit alcohol dehydrogenase family)
MPKVAVITGGAGGMGLATARLIGRSAAVLICDIDQERLRAAANELTDLGIECDTALCDITDRDSVCEVVERARALGTVTSVVHTAGVSPGMGSAEKVLRINALGTVVVNEAFYQIAGKGMAVVNVASVAGHQLSRPLVPTSKYKRALTDIDRFVNDMVTRCKPVPHRWRPHVAYMLSKNFVIWYSRVTATKWGDKGARILSVSPGSFDTPMGRAEAASGAMAMTQFGALKRLGDPEEIAEVLAFCASDKPGYLTGTDIICDGGVTAAMTLGDALKLAFAT